MPPSSASSSPSSISFSDNSPRPPRCPLALQEIFLASNAGNEVHTPPPANMASKTFQRRAEWNFHAQQQQQQQQQPKRSLLLLVNPFSRAATTTTTATTTPTAPPPSLLGVSKSRAKSLAQRIPLHAQQDALFADVLPNFSDKAKKLMSPQEFLNALLQDDDPRRAKYYSTESYSVKDSAYYNQPTVFQLKSYGSHLTDMVRRSNANALRDLLVSCNNKGQLGLSPNACNIYGESIVTMICRRGDLALLQVLMDTGCCSLQVSDDCGRTPLHDACWTSSSQPCFEVVEIILKADARLLYMKDARGALPLDYVPKQHWDAWKRFLIRVVLDAYFPIIDSDNDEQHADKKQGPPELTRYAPNSRPLSTPPNSLPNALAAMVAFGKLAPDEARMMAAPDTDDDDDYTDDDDSDNDDDEATVGSSTSNCDEDDVDDDDSSSSNSRSSGSSSSSDGEDYDSEEDDDEEEEDDESYDFAVNNPDEEDMDQALVMTGSLLTGKLL